MASPSVAGAGKSVLWYVILFDTLALKDLGGHQFRSHRGDQGYAEVGACNTRRFLL